MARGNVALRLYVGRITEHRGFAAMTAGFRFTLAVANVWRSYYRYAMA
jgi:hypothetical protein